jgi:hypothetical protein
MTHEGYIRIRPVAATFSGFGDPESLHTALAHLDFTFPGCELLLTTESEKGMSRSASCASCLLSKPEALRLARTILAVVGDDEKGEG